MPQRPKDPKAKTLAFKPPTGFVSSVEVTGVLILQQWCPAERDRLRPEGLAFDKSLGRLLYPGLEIGHMASTRGPWPLLKGDGIRMWQSGDLGHG